MTPSLLVHLCVFCCILTRICCFGETVERQSPTQFHPDSTANVPQREFQALNDLYLTTNGTNWRWKSAEFGSHWNFVDANANPCVDHWQGINCTFSATEEMYHVIEIDLLDYNMVGYLPDSIGNLTELAYLILQRNRLTSTVPHTLTQLSFLQVLDLQYNHFHGTVPAYLGQMTTLRGLMLGRNKFTGTIPSALGNLTELHLLLMGYNHLIGSIPPALCNLVNMAFFDGSGNHLNGSLPVGIGRLSNLAHLNLFNNTLSGTVPASAAHLSALQSLTLGWNNFDGPLPECVTQLPNLAYLDLFRNHFTGTIPASYGQMAALEVLYVNMNLLEGPIDAICGCTKLGQLYLENNAFSGSLPDCLQQLHRLRNLYVFNNHITGNLPATIGALSGLQYIDVDTNLLTGTIPDSFTHLHKLKFVFLFDNFLHGTVPAGFSQLESMTFLLLQNNHFSGSIQSLFNTTVQHRLNTIQLSSNAFTGHLPADVFSNSPNLTTFSAVENCLGGSIPVEICECQSLNILALDGVGTAAACRTKILPGLTDSYIVTHAISGGIPPCLFQMQNLTTLHLSGNGITGSIPSDITLGPRLLDLAMSHNVLTGSIPLTIQERVWYSLDLSYNRFSGSLESTFNTLPVKIGRMFQVGVFDIGQTYTSENTFLSLQNNRLSGDIPDTVYALTDITILNGNIFQCDWDQSNLPAHDSGKNSYQCGSNAVNAQLYAWLIIAGVVVIVSLAVRQWPQTIDKYVSVVECVEILKKWYRAVDQPELQGKLKNFKYVCRVGNVIFRIATWCTALIVVVGVPFYVIISQYYGTVTHMYAWTVSALYTSGEVPFALEFVAYISLLFFVVALMIRYKRLYLKIVKEEDEERPSEIFTRPTLTANPAAVAAVDAVPVSVSVPASSIYSAYVTFFVINFALVIGVNVAFVYIALYENNAILLLAQLLLSFFKGFWNSYGAMFLMRWSFHTVATNETAEADFINTQLFAALFNNIAIPCLVVAAVSPDCFYNLLVRAPNVNVYYIYLECGVFVEEMCVFYYPTVAGTSYTPPFTYSYQCGAQYVMAYAPTFVYLGIEVAFMSPLALALSQRLHARAAPGTLWFRFLDYWIVYPNLKPFDKTLTGAVPRDLYNPFFDANQLVVLLMTYLGVILTFGVVFPPLAVVMLVAIASQILTNRLVMGRYISTALEEQVPQYLDAIELDSQGVGLLHLSRLRASVWLMVWFCCWFYALYLFEVLGNANGLSGSIWVFIALPLVPVGLYIVQQITRRRNRAAMLRALRLDSSNIELRQPEASMYSVNPMSEVGRGTSDAVRPQSTITVEDLAAEREEHF